MKTKLFAFGVLLGALPQISSAVILYGGGTYADNLDGLGTSTPWANDSTLPGWYAFEASGSWDVVSGNGHDDYAISSGGGFPQQGLLNFGTNNSSGNRALGSRPAGKSYTFALVLQNNTSSAFTDFSLSYYGEQWQKNAPYFQSFMKLSFSYGVFSGFDGGRSGTVVPFQDYYAGYTVPAGNALDFSAFVFGDTVGALDGDAPANRRPVSATQSVDWQPGQFLVLRWLAPQPNIGGNVSQMLAVDDVQLTATPTPEPSAALLACIGFGLLACRRNRKTP